MPRGGLRSRRGEYDRSWRAEATRLSGPRRMQLVDSGRARQSVAPTACDRLRAPGRSQGGAFQHALCDPSGARARSHRYRARRPCHPRRTTRRLPRPDARSHDQRHGRDRRGSPRRTSAPRQRLLVLPGPGRCQRASRGGLRATREGTRRSRPLRRNAVGGPGSLPVCRAQPRHQAQRPRGRRVRGDAGRRAGRARPARRRDRCIVLGRGDGKVRQMRTWHRHLGRHRTTSGATSRSRSRRASARSPSWTSASWTSHIRAGSRSTSGRSTIPTRWSIWSALASTGSSPTSRRCLPACWATWGRTGRCDGQPRPQFGFLPWLAFFFLRSLRLTVRLDTSGTV